MKLANVEQREIHGGAKTDHTNYYRVHIFHTWANGKENSSIIFPIFEDFQDFFPDYIEECTDLCSNNTGCCVFHQADLV